MEEPIDGRFARLASDVEYIKKDVADLKIDVRRLNDKIDGVRDSLTAKIDGLRKEMNERFLDLHREIASMKVWALVLYFGLAGTLLLVMAKGFKWI